MQMKPDHAKGTSPMIKGNQQHRAMFTLPPIMESAEALPAVQGLPSQQVVTGDKEVDAVLWLRKVISTGQPGPIATAMEAAKKIKTPLEELEKRYAQILGKANPGDPFVIWSSFGFADLEGLAERSIEKRRLQTEALSRFPGESIWDDTPAEQFCEKALKRCKGFKDYIDNDKAEVAKGFRKHADLMPNTLSDCLYELSYWDHLYKLRSSVGECGDGMHEAIAREWFVRSLLEKIKPQSRDEAVQVLDYVAVNDSIEHDHMVDIFRNLLDHPGLVEVGRDGTSRIVKRKAELSK